MDFIRGLAGLSVPPIPPPADSPTLSQAATGRAAGASLPDRPAAGLQWGEAAPLAAQGVQIMSTLVGLLGQLLLGQSRGGTSNSSGGSPSPALGPIGGAGTSGGTGSAPPPVQSSAAVGNSGQDVSPNASGTAFPVVGYRGQIGLHHGSNRGGADLFAPRGTPVVAMRGGTVQSVGTSGAGGNSVTLKGDDGLMYYYAHMDQAPAVAQGQQVRVGQPLGVVGDSGNAKGTGTHLHLGIGKQILSGVGPSGGTGSDFDATSYLRQALNASPAQAAT